MPTYEYACTACAEHIEVVQSFTDASLTDCPSCSGRLRKVFSPVGVVFKGSGFYKTDSRDSKSKATKSETKSDGKSETKTDTKSDSTSGATSSGDSSSAAAKSGDGGASSATTTSPSTGTAAAG